MEIYCFSSELGENLSLQMVSTIWRDLVTRRNYERQPTATVTASVKFNSILLFGLGIACTRKPMPKSLEGGIVENISNYPNDAYGQDFINIAI